MRYFCGGFEKLGILNTVGKPNKRHVIVLYFSKNSCEAEDAIRIFGKVKMKYPTVKIKMVSTKEKESPLVVLLQNGQEVSRLAGTDARSESMLAQLFRRANS